MLSVKYDAREKVWSRTIIPRFHHESVSIGYVAITELAKFPDRIVQIDHDTGYRMTSVEMRSKIIRAAVHLERLNLVQGDVIGVCARNGRDLTPMVIGCLLNGYTVNAVDVSFSKDDIQNMFEITEPKVILCDADQYVKLVEVIRNIRISPTIVTFGKQVEACDYVDEYFQETHRELFYMPTNLKYGDDQAAFIVCSSGTTGYHKGICISHSQFIKKITCRTAFRLVNTFATTSLYWLSGIDNMLLSVLNCYTRIITTQSVTDELLFKIISEYKVNHVFIPPLYLAVMLRSPLLKSADLSSIKCLSVAGSAAPSASLEEIQNYLPSTSFVIYVYGMTEMCGVCCANASRKNLTSVGSLYTDVQARIIDGNGKSLGPNETGKLVMRDVCYKFLGYKNNPMASSEICDRNGWMHSGDIAHFDDDGQLYITGRHKDIIKFKNYHVSPTELEEILGNFKGINQVCVFGMPDTVAVDLPAALIVINEWFSEFEFKKYIDDKLPEYKKLHGGFYIVDSIPQTVNGKFKRKEALETAIRMKNVGKL